MINRAEIEIIKSTSNAYNDDRQFRSKASISIPSRIQDDELFLSPFIKRVLIVDDDIDITFTFKAGLEAENSNDNNKIVFKVYTCNNPLEALSQFNPNFYDLLLVDINMPKIDGFELSAKISELDPNVRICFMSAGIINQEALREQYPNRIIGCFLTKPVSISYLVKRLREELE